MRDVNSYMGKGMDRNWAGTCPVPLWRDARGQGAQYKAIIHCREAPALPAGRQGRGASLILFRKPSSSGKR